MQSHKAPDRIGSVLTTQMLITPHAVTGATIAVLVPHPFLALPLAVASHFVLDSMPHWQEIVYPYDVTWKTWLRIPIDIVVAVTLVTLIIQTHPGQAPLIVLSTLAAIAPDADTLLIIWKKPHKIRWLKKFFDWHNKIQWETKSFWGVVTQVLLCELFLALTL